MHPPASNDDEDQEWADIEPVPPDEELDVMRLVALGLKDDSIARCLEISVMTVRRRIRRFRGRVGANTRVDAAVMGVRRGWL